MIFRFSLTNLVDKERSIPPAGKKNTGPRIFVIVLLFLNNDVNKAVITLMNIIIVLTPLIGTIFGVYRRVTPVGTVVTRQDFLQAGSQQVAAGYVVYGSSTMLVYSAGGKVNGFTLDPSLGEFCLSHHDIKIPKKGKIYSINESYKNSFSK